MLDLGLAQQEANGGNTGLAIQRELIMRLVAVRKATSGVMG